MVSCDLVTVGFHRDDRPQPDPAAGLGRLDDRRHPEPGLDRLDPTLQEGLLLASRGVVGVLLEVAELLGGADPGDDLRAAPPGELLELGAEARLALAGQVRGVGGAPSGVGDAVTAAGSTGGLAGTVPRGLLAGVRRRFGSGGSPRAPSASPSGSCTIRVGGRGASTGSGEQRPRQARPLPFAGRRAASVANGRTTSGSGSDARSVVGDAVRERAGKRILVLLDRRRRGPPDARPGRHRESVRASARSMTGGGRRGPSPGSPRPDG